MKLTNKQKKNFEAHLGIDKSDNNKCWTWTGTTTKGGYGQVKINKKGIRANRLAYELYKGPIPKGMNVCHTCDNPPCCNPKHLFSGTVKDNAEDKVRKNRQPKGISHGRAKLIEKEVKEIREKYKTGNYTLVQLGVEYKVLHTLIGMIIRREIWKHI